MADFLNANGLVQGRIPAGKDCPFLKECRLVNERCPGAVVQRPTAYSCAAARAHSLSKVREAR